MSWKAVLMNGPTIFTIICKWFCSSSRDLHQYHVMISHIYMWNCTKVMKLDAKLPGSLHDVASILHMHTYMHWYFSKWVMLKNTWEGFSLNMFNHPPFWQIPIWIYIDHANWPWTFVHICKFIFKTWNQKNPGLQRDRILDHHIIVLHLNTQVQFWV